MLWGSVPTGTPSAVEVARQVMRAVRAPQQEPNWHRSQFAQLGRGARGGHGGLVQRPR